MKQTYSKPVTVWNPDLGGPTSKIVASSSVEVSHLKLVASGGAAHIDLYNNATTNNPTDLVWSLDASTTANDDNDFANPLLFSKGIFAVLTQGSGFNPQLCVATISPTV